MLSVVSGKDPDCDVLALDLFDCLCREAIEWILETCHTDELQVLFFEFGQEFKEVVS